MEFRSERLLITSVGDDGNSIWMLVVEALSKSWLDISQIQHSHSPLSLPLYLFLSLFLFIYLSLSAASIPANCIEVNASILSSFYISSLFCALSSSFMFRMTRMTSFWASSMTGWTSSMTRPSISTSVRCKILKK